MTVNNADQNLTHNTTTNVSMQTEHWDTNTMHGATLYRHDINTAGTFIIFGAGAFSLADLDGFRSIELSVSGGAPRVRMTIPAVPVVTSTALQVSHTGLMTAADYIDLQGYQNSGSTLPVLAGTAWMLSHWCGNP